MAPGELAHKLGCPSSRVHLPLGRKQRESKEPNQAESAGHPAATAGAPRGQGSCQVSLPGYAPRLTLPWQMGSGATPPSRRLKICGQRLPASPGLGVGRSPALPASVLVVTVPITCLIIQLPFRLIYQSPNFSARKHFSLAFI